MKKITAIASLMTATALLGLGSVAHAEYTGPNSEKKRAENLAQILKKPVDDQAVRLSGYLVSKVGKDEYLFSDGKNQIVVEIDKKVFPKQSISEKDRIIIEGEVDVDKNKAPEIDVKRIILP